MINIWLSVQMYGQKDKALLRALLHMSLGVSVPVPFHNLSNTQMHTHTYIKVFFFLQYMDVREQFFRT